MKKLLVLPLILMLTGCAMMGQVMDHRHLKVSTKMSDTIFIDPIAIKSRVAYVSVKNTSDFSNVHLKPIVESTLRANGWQITNDASKAYALLQVNVLQAGENSQSNADNMISNGFGGAALGAGIGALAGSNSGNVAGGAAIGAAAAAIGGMFFKNVTYTLTTDIQVSVRTEKAVQVEETTAGDVSNGSRGKVVVQSSKRTVNWNRYQTRIIAIADKVNLKKKEAMPALEQKIGQSIGNIL